MGTSFKETAYDSEWKSSSNTNLTTTTAPILFSSANTFNEAERYNLVQSIKILQFDSQSSDHQQLASHQCFSRKGVPFKSFNEIAYPSASKRISLSIPNKPHTVVPYFQVICCELTTPQLISPSLLRHLMHT